MNQSDRSMSIGYLKQGIVSYWFFGEKYRVLTENCRSKYIYLALELSKIIISEQALTTVTMAFTFFRTTIVRGFPSGL